MSAITRPPFHRLAGSLLPPAHKTTARTRSSRGAAQESLRFTCPPFRSSIFKELAFEAMPPAMRTGRTARLRVNLDLRAKLDDPFGREVEVGRPVLLS